ncbi:ABC transporter permease [Pseudonocardia sp. H11422]|uniref:ABC transporter permease n=1 Tax=Pseudonocardia sp. H11422 TaxID=2835866 RepID=UPI001BDC898D|nr:ABC transporter permease [Pseudonocardia sp. H11422]
MTSAYPLGVDALTDRVRALAAELGDWPSQNRVAAAFKVGKPKARAALDALRAEGFDPAAPGTEAGAEPPTVPVLRAVPDAADTAAEAVLEPAESAVERPAEPVPVPGTADDAATGEVERSEQVSAPAAPATNPGTRRARVPRWPLLVIALGAFVSIWGGWVGLGELAGFGPVRLLPGIADSFVINSAITLPLGVEAYAAFAMWTWLAPPAAGVSDRARRFACWSSIAALGLGVFGQAAYHLLVTGGVTTAPWPVVVFVSCLPVLVLGAGAALAHLIHGGEAAR